jgi:puromycin-sensitive aminopeptidase
MWDQFTTDHLSSALRLDALKSSHPIQVPIHHAEEVEQVFDAISYCKGGSVVRMIRAVIGAPAFQTGLQAYMKKHAYGNTETFDLWSAWETSSGMPIKDLMASWTEQMGFPLVRVIKEEWKGDEVTLELDQVWFLSDGSELTPEEAEKKWAVPIITCTTEGQQKDMMLMRDKTATLMVSLSAGGWVKLNAGQEVPMRVLYTPEMIDRLSQGIQSKSLSPRDRAGLVNDAYALVKAGYMKPESLIKLLAACSAEDQLIVWGGLADALGGLDMVLSDDEKLGANFTKFARRLVLQLVEKISWESSTTDGHLTTLLRAKMINLASTFCADDPSVAQEASTRFKAFLEDPSDVKSLPSDMKTAVFKIVLISGGIAEYNHIKSYFETATDNAERKHVLNALGYAPDSKLKLATLEWTTSGAVKLQDFFYAIGSVSRSSKSGREIAWKYFQDNFDKLNGMLSNASASLMDAVIIYSAGAFCSKEKADEIDAFFAAHPLPRNVRKVAQTVEAMRANAKFLDLLKASDLSKDEFWESL